MIKLIFIVCGVLFLLGIAKVLLGVSVVNKDKDQYFNIDE